MKKQNDFSNEYGVYKNGRKLVYGGWYIYERILVKRGFYNRNSAYNKAVDMSKDGNHYMVYNVNARPAVFWEDWAGNRVFYDGKNM